MASHNNNNNNAESNWKLPHLFTSSKIATLVPAFAMEDLPLDRTTILIPVFAVNEPALEQKVLNNNNKSIKVILNPNKLY